MNETVDGAAENRAITAKQLAHHVAGAHILSNLRGVDYGQMPDISMTQNCKIARTAPGLHCLACDDYRVSAMSCDFFLLHICPFSNINTMLFRIAQHWCCWRDMCHSLFTSSFLRLMRPSWVWASTGLFANVRVAAALSCTAICANGRFLEWFACSAHVQDGNACFTNSGAQMHCIQDFPACELSRLLKQLFPAVAGPAEVKFHVMCSAHKQNLLSLFHKD